MVTHMLVGVSCWSNVPEVEYWCTVDNNNNDTDDDDEGDDDDQMIVVKNTFHIVVHNISSMGCMPQCIR